MHDSTGQSAMRLASRTGWYSYAIVRVVPHVERGEFINAGVVLFAREARWLAARFELDHARLLALAPTADALLIERHLATFLSIASGDEAGGPIAALTPSERFHWLTAPRSTIIQVSPVHAGQTDDPAAAIAELLDAYVRVSRDTQSLAAGV